MPLEPLPKELQAAAIANALESSAPISRPSISILGYGVTTKPIVAFLNACGKSCAIYDDKLEGKRLEMKNADSSSGGDVENILLDSREFCAESSALEILSPGIPPDHRYFGRARRAISEYDFIWWLENSALGSQGRVGFLAKNGDSKETSANAERYPLFCCGEPAVITTQGNSLDSPCKAPFLTQKSCREDTALESTFETTANPRILEDKQNAQESSSRADEIGVAIHKSTQVDSSETYSASTESMDCHATATVAARNDRKNAIGEKADSRKNAESVKTPQAQANLDSRETAQNVSESQNKKAENVFCSQVDRRQDLGDRIVALQGESRAHTRAYVTADSPQQSAILAPKPTPQKSSSDSKILELESGLFEPRKEIRLGGLSTQCGDEIHDSSPKAKSPPTQIWVSGTNGKTTTTQMLESILAPYGARAGGNIGTPLITLYEQNTPLWILETSSFALHYTQVATPQIYALLPLSPDHISWHNGFENYVSDKLSPLARMGADSVAIVPSVLKDHRLCKEFAGEMVFYTDSSDLRAFLHAKGLELSENDLPFFEPFLLDASIALASAVALASLSPSALTKAQAASFVSALSSFKIGAHRVEEFYVHAFGERWLFVDDSKGTNLDATLKAIERYASRALFLILGGDDKGADMQEIFTLLAELKRVEIFTIGTNEPKLLDLAMRHSVKAHKCGTLDCAMQKIWAMIAESVDSKETSAIAKRYPLFSKEATLCHANADALARNDEKTAESQKVDSRDNAKNVENSQNKKAENVFSQNADRRQDLGDRIVALQGESRAHTRAYVTADSPQQSAILAPKPTPKLSQEFVCLLSPAAASLDQFSSYKERGERFKALARDLATTP